jgi:hypothetical protein
MVDFEPGFDITPQGVSFIARVDGHLVACWVDSSVLAEKEGLEGINSASLRKAFKKHETAIKNGIIRKIAEGTAEPDRTFCLRSGEF